MEKQKLFIVSELFYPDTSATSRIMTEVASYLDDYYNLQIISTNTRYDNNTNINPKYSKLKVIRKKTGNINKNNIFSRIKGAISSSLVMSWEVINKVKKNDKVLLVTNPFLGVLFISALRVFKRFDYILLVHDVFPENLVPAQLMHEKSIKYRFLKLMFKLAYSKADKLIAIGEDMKNILMQKGIKSDKISIISNWADNEVHKKEVDREKYYDIPNLTEKIVVGFAGNIGRVQNLHKIAHLFNKSENENLTLLIIGDGAKKNELIQEIKPIKNIHYIGARPSVEQTLFLNTFDIGLITLSPGMYGMGVPSKVYNLLKLGIPIFYIGDKNSEIDLILRNYDLGWSFTWNDHEQIIETLKSINNNAIAEKTDKSSVLYDLYDANDKLYKFIEVLNK